MTWLDLALYFNAVVAEGEQVRVFWQYREADKFEVQFRGWRNKQKKPRLLLCETLTLAMTLNLLRKCSLGIFSLKERKEL